jgi:hypothetical protein
MNRTDIHHGFRDCVVDKLEDAIICHTYPVLEEEDMEFIDFLLPLNVNEVYLFYTIKDINLAIQIGESCSEEEGAEMNDLGYFLEDYDEKYVKYLRVHGLKNLRYLPPIHANIEDLWNQILIRYNNGGAEDVREYLDTIELVREWKGRTTNHSALEEIKEIIREVAIDKCTMKYNTLPSMKETYELSALINALCPNMVHPMIQNNADGTMTKKTLPWNITLDEEDYRTDIVRLSVLGKIPVKIDPEAPVTGYYYEED